MTKQLYFITEFQLKKKRFLLLYTRKRDALYVTDCKLVLPALHHEQSYVTIVT